MNENTANVISRILAEILPDHGVRHAVVSPGSRNAPILVALSRAEKPLRLTTVIDERSAGFVALGIAAITDEPVLLVCTSGTALLNYAPAVAEAYYRNLPLIVVSADRPAPWIDQDDSQTLRQPGALANFTKRSYNIPTSDSEENQWYANRSINDALILAMSGERGPVHINLQIAEPIGLLTDKPIPRQRIVVALAPKPELPTAEARALGRLIASPRKVMIVGGFHAPDSTLNKALVRLTQLPNVVVLTETIANLHSPDFISCIDSTLSVMTPEQRAELAPDVVISFGGALVSRYVKKYLRESRPLEHWHVGLTDRTVDCFQALTQRILMPPSLFFRQLASAMQPHRADCKYARRWSVLANRAFSLGQAFVARAPWTDLKAFSVLIPLIPRRWNVQYSNGTSIRYAQLFGTHEYHRCDCNRGVSGIDGSTSTAVGASIAAPDRVTLLVTGDMSAAYDVGVLGANCLTPRFKMVVVCNGGGGIFRFIGNTRNLEEREHLLCVEPNLPLRQLADGYGFSYFEADSEPSLRAAFKQFAAESERSAILAINTPKELSAQTLIDYFRRAELLEGRD